MEEWKLIIGFIAYEVSNLGNVRSIDRYVNHPSGGLAKRKGVLLKKLIDKDGYFRVNLKVNQKTNTRNIHKLVAESFIENPDNKPQINHKNGIKQDNHFKNLEWCTMSENRVHAYATGLQDGKSREGTKNNFHKLSDSEVIYIRKSKSKQLELARKFGVTQCCISDIVNFKTWKHI